MVMSKNLFFPLSLYILSFPLYPSFFYSFAHLFLFFHLLHILLFLWQLIELTGYTRRVAKMFTVFEQVGRGKFIRGSQVHLKLRKSNVLQLGPDGAPILRGVIKEVPNFIRLNCVPVITPNLDTVIENITLTVRINNAFAIHHLKITFFRFHETCTY